MMPVPHVRMIAVAFAANLLVPFASGSERLYQVAPPANELAAQLFPASYRNTRTKPAASRLAALPIRFHFDSTTVLPESLPMLESIGGMLLLPRIRRHAIVVEGHTDSIGDANYNQHLSERRAVAIRDYLAGAFGIDPRRIEVLGRGESRPLDAGYPANPVNRRVTLRRITRPTRFSAIRLQLDGVGR